MAIVNPNFPLSEWDRLIFRANVAFNLLRSARCNPKLSAHSYIFGTFNFLATPLAPPGNKIVAHVHPDKWGSWELNEETGWYVGPASQHYRCLQCYFLRTRETLVYDTVEFFPHAIECNAFNLTYFLVQAASDILHILTQKPNSIISSLVAGDPVRNSHLTLATQLKRIQNIPEPAQIKNPHTQQNFWGWKNNI